MSRRKISALCSAALFIIFQPALAGDSPEVMYDVWVRASKAGDIDGLLAVSSAAKVKEFQQEFTTPEKREEIRKLIKLMAPITYKVKKTEISQDGNKASLLVDATARDFFSLNDPKAKPERETIEVRMVKENDRWKVDQQCSGKDGCGKEPDWTPLAWGQAFTLPKGGFKAKKGKSSDFKGVTPRGKGAAVDLVFQFPEGGDTLHYFLHRSPSFAKFYLSVGEEKITPVAWAIDFPGLSSEGGRDREVTVMEENYSYNQNRNFTGEGRLSLLFDVPKEAKGPQALHVVFTYGDKEYAFEVK